MFDSAGPGGPESFDEVPWPRGSPSPILVVERKSAPAGLAGVNGVTAQATGGRTANPATNLVGLDVPLFVDR